MAIQASQQHWQTLKQELDVAALQGKVADVKLRVLHEPTAEQTPAAIEIAYCMNGQQFVRTFRANAYELTSAFTTPLETGIETVAFAIRELMAQGLPETWATACTVARIESGESGLTYGQYKAAAEEEAWHSFDTDYRLYIAFDALRQQLQSSCGEAWTTAQAMLLPTGSLVFSFSYGTTGEPSRV